MSVLNSVDTDKQLSNTRQEDKKTGRQANQEKV